MLATDDDEEDICLDADALPMDGLDDEDPQSAATRFEMKPPQRGRAHT